MTYKEIQVAKVVLISGSKADRNSCATRVLAQSRKVKDFRPKVNMNLLYNSTSSFSEFKNNWLLTGGRTNQRTD